MSPSNPNARRDVLSTELMRGYGNRQGGLRFQADNIAPMAPTGAWDVRWFDKANGWAAATPDLDYYRALGGNYPAITVSLSQTAGPTCQDFGVSWSVTDAEASQWRQNGIDIDMVKMEEAADVFDIRREQIIQALVQNTTTASSASRLTQLTAATQLDNPASELMSQVKTWLLAHIDAKGVPANAVAMPDDVALAIAYHAEANEHWSRTNDSMGSMVDGLGSPDLLQRVIGRVFGFDPSNVFICDSRANTAQAGQSESLARIWGKHITLYNRVTSFSPNRPNGAFLRYCVSDETGLHEREVVRWGEQGGMAQSGAIRSWEVFAAASTTWNEAYLIQDAIG